MMMMKRQSNPNRSLAHIIILGFLLNTNLVTAM